MALPAFRMKEFTRRFPNVSEVEVRWLEEGEGLPEGGVKKGPLSLSEGNLEGTLRCANFKCGKGGFEITQPLQKMIDNQESEREVELTCHGFLGSRRRSAGMQQCQNTARVKLRVFYRE